MRVSAINDWKIREWWKRDNPLTRRIPNYICDFCALEEAAPSPTLLNRGLHSPLPSKEHTVGMGRGDSPQCRSLTNTASARWPRSTGQSVTSAKVTNQIDSVYLWCDVMKVALSPCGPPPKTHSSRLIMRKTFQLRDILQNRTSTPQNWQGHQQQGKSEKLSLPRGASGGMTTTGMRNLGRTQNNNNKKTIGKN